MVPVKTGGNWRGCALWGAAAAALCLCLAAAWQATGAGALPPAGPAVRATGRPAAAGPLRPAAVPGMAPAVPLVEAVRPAPDSPAQLQAQARLYADCQAWDAGRVQGVVSELDESYAVDPSGVLAAAYRDVEQLRIAQCRQVGIAEYRQVEPLMQAAAHRGEPRARLFLIEQTLRRVAERAAEARALGETDPAADAARTAQTKASLNELEQLALEGWLPAVQALAGAWLASDPLRAAAWQLVASHPPGDDRPLTVQDLAASGTLTPLSAEDSARVVSQAQQLRLALRAPAR